MDIKVFYFNSLRECCYVIWDETSECAIVDPGCLGPGEFSRLKGFVSEKGLRPVRILLTHGHLDHIFGLQACYDEWHPEVNIHPEDIFQTEYAPVMASELGIDMPAVNCPFVTVTDGQELKVGEMVITVLHTPGHTAGGVCYYCAEDNVLFCGDTLFAGSVGRCDLPKGDARALMASLQTRIARLPHNTDIFPGHGYPTTVGTELQMNPYLKQNN